jgi:signal transduction histidine kinase
VKRFVSRWRADRDHEVCLQLLENIHHPRSIRERRAPTGRHRIGRAAALVLFLGVGATILIFVVARANVQDSERSLVRERTSQTLGVISTVVQQVEAIVAAGAAAAEYTNDNPQAFENATEARVWTSLVSNLSLVRIAPGGPNVVASVGRSRPLLLGKLNPREVKRLHQIARSGSDLKYVAGAKVPGGRLIGFAKSLRGGEYVLYAEITAIDAEAQAGGAASGDLRFGIYLGGKPMPSALVLSSPDGPPTGASVVKNGFRMGEEQILVALGPRHRLVSGFTWAAPWIMLAIGLIGSVALAGLVETGRRRRDEALALVADLERRTTELDRALAEQRRAEQDAHAAAEKLRHAERMEAIGRLAGGVAHDFNNLLTAIIGSTRLLLRRTRRGDPARTGLEDIERAADRAASLTRQLLAFSRKQVLQPTVVDLNRIVRDSETMLHHLIRADIRLLTSLDPRLAPVEADAGQLEQVIINLVINAVDALPGGGQIVIATNNMAATGNGTRGQIPARSYAVLSVSDDGVGMDAETRERVFEPFFTTKELGRGTGLGLATVYGIVEQSGGSIEVESRPGRGTTFRIYLPGVDKAVAQPSFGPGSSESTAGTETVMVAEDDAMVRALVRVILEESGYTVIEASSGDEALRLSQSYDGPIDVLVTDMVMPGMGGRAVAERLLALRHELRVLYISGYSEDEVLGGGSDAEASFIGKPFTPEELALKVRALIDRPRSVAQARYG